MANIPYVIGFDAGLTSVGFTLLNTDGSVFAARSTTGVTEIGPSRYSTTETVADADLPKDVLWDDGSGVEAVTCIEAPLTFELDEFTDSINDVQTDIASVPNALLQALIGAATFPDGSVGKALQDTFKDGDNIQVDVGGVTRTGLHTKV